MKFISEEEEDSIYNNIARPAVNTDVIIVSSIDTNNTKTNGNQHLKRSDEKAERNTSNNDKHLPVKTVYKTKVKTKLIPKELEKIAPTRRALRKSKRLQNERRLSSAKSLPHTPYGSRKSARSSTKRKLRASSRSTPKSEWLETMSNASTPQSTASTSSASDKILRSVRVSKSDRILRNRK